MKNDGLSKGGMVILAASAMLLLGTMVSQAGTPKNPPVLLDQIHAQNDVSCSDCHQPGQKRVAVTMLRCLDCHDTEDIAQATADVEMANPHRSNHYGTEADCNLCHHQHQASENYCTPCHLRFEFKVP